MNLKEALNNEEIVKKLESAGGTEEAAAILKEYSIEITEEEAAELAVAVKGELTEENLEEVAGGVSFDWKLLLPFGYKKGQKEFLLGYWFGKYGIKKLKELLHMK